MHFCTFNNKWIGMIHITRDDGYGQSRELVHVPSGMAFMPTQNVWYPRSHWSQNIISSSWWGCWHTVHVLHSMHCQRYVWMTHTRSSLMSRHDGWPVGPQHSDEWSQMIANNHITHISSYILFFRADDQVKNYSGFDTIVFLKAA